jgi:hypothetical protein
MAWQLKIFGQTLSNPCTTTGQTSQLKIRIDGLLFF